MSDGSILVVRHGPGRGRIPGYLQEALDYVGAGAFRIRLHATSMPMPDLAGVRAVVFWLADPLRELYPECYSEAQAIAEAARARGARLINPPDALSNSVKSVQSALWRAAGIPTPEYLRISDREELERALAEDRYPLFLRSDVLHSQQGLHFLRNRQAAGRLDLSQVSYPASITPFVDTRESYREADPGSIWARYYHKKRAFVFGDIVTTNHVYFSPNPVVGLSTSTFGWYTGMRRRLRLAQIFPRERACLAADYEYWKRDGEHHDLLRRAARVLGLEFVAFDYATFADGRAILWEANPYFFLHDAGRSVLPRARRTAERTYRHYDHLRTFFSRLAEANGH